MDQVIWLENGSAQASVHDALVQNNPEYKRLYEVQAGGSDHEQK